MATGKTVEYVTVSQVVEATGHTEMSVYNWRHGVTRSKLKSKKIKVGERHKVVIAKSDLITWAEKEGIKLRMSALRKTH